MDVGFVAFFATILFGIIFCDDTMPVSVDRYFELDGDLTKVTWAHAVNSVAKLEEALSGSVMMIEADVILGQLQGSEIGANPIPVMAHPPATTSDLSLEQFITKVVASGKKGIKLDFKTTEVFQGSENILEEFLNKAETNFPFWLNADILPGPVNSQVTPVDADYFLKTSVTKFPTAMLSIGWTTNYGNGISVGNYTVEHIDNMTDALSRNSVTKPVTFPVRAGIAAQSLQILTKLINSATSGTTLTIWSHDNDPVDYAALTKLIDTLGRKKVYIDIPNTMKTKLNSSVSMVHPSLNLMYCLLAICTVLATICFQY